MTTSGLRTRSAAALGSSATLAAFRVGGYPALWLSGAACGIRLGGHPGGDRLDHADRLRLDPCGGRHVRHPTRSGAAARHPARWPRRPVRPSSHADPRQPRGDRPVAAGRPSSLRNGTLALPQLLVLSLALGVTDTLRGNGDPDVLVRPRRRRRGDECHRPRQPRCVPRRGRRVDRRAVSPSTGSGSAPRSSWRPGWRPSPPSCLVLGGARARRERPASHLAPELLAVDDAHHCGTDVSP